MAVWLQLLLGACGMACTVGTIMIQSGRWLGRQDGLSGQLSALLATQEQQFTTWQAIASRRHSEVTARIGSLELDVRELKTINSIRGLRREERT